MPVAAAGLADVRTGDPQPLVLGRRGQHPLQQLAVARLELGLLLQLPPRFTYPRRQRIANPLQLTQAKRPRLTRYRDNAGVQAQAREGLSDERTELRFESPDLAPQLDTREPLVAIDAKLSAYLSLKQIRHSPPASVDHGHDPKAVALLSAPSHGQRRRDHP